MTKNGEKLKVIFLDFDGVIVTAHTRYRSGDPWCVHLLNDIVKKTGAKVVVSSSWRMGSTVSELQAELDSWGVKVDVIDKTPVDHEVQRGVEIKRWLDTRKDVESFVILDDDTDMGELASRLVKTNPRHGLDSGDVDRAVAHLSTNVQ